MPLQVHSIFESFDGEVNYYHQGRRATFLRLQGCNATCTYCDTVRAQDPAGGVTMSIETAAQDIIKRTPTKLTITGGEPLLQQKAVVELIHMVWKTKPGMDISIETNGTQAIGVDLMGLNDVSIIMDFKLPSAGMPINPSRNHHELGPKDWIKFVIGSSHDFTEAVATIQMIQNGGCQAGIALSPLHGVIEPPQLAEWISVSTLKDVVLNLQLHKLIWPDAGPNEER